MKIILQIIGGIFLVFALVAGFSSAKDWLILNKLSGYEKDQFTITGVRVSHGTGDAGTDYYLQGHGGRGEYEFAISAARYETLSSATAVGRKIIVFRNPSMASLSFQKESVNVFFEDDWREPEEVELSAKSTMWMGLIAMSVAAFAFVFARSVSRHRARTGQGDGGNSSTLRALP